MGPQLAIADGALGFWKALPRGVAEDASATLLGAQDRECPEQAAEEPARQRPSARSASGWPRPGRPPKPRSIVPEIYGTKYDKAVECLTKDREALLAFYDFPAEHWKHLRTTNPIESTFATVRHRTIRSRGCLSNKTALAMTFKLAQAAEESWHRLRGYDQLPKVIMGVKFKDGIEIVRSHAQAAAA